MSTFLVHLSTFVHPRRDPAMTTRCNWSDCERTDTRPYACGPRDPQHTPSALAGVPEPDQLLEIGRRNLAERHTKEATR
jgi:hypothetical protein